MSPIIRMIRMVDVSMRRLIMVMINIYILMYTYIPLNGDIFMGLLPYIIIGIHRRLFRILIVIMVTGIITAAINGWSVFHLLRWWCRMVFCGGRAIRSRGRVIRGS